MPPLNTLKYITHEYYTLEYLMNQVLGSEGSGSIEHLSFFAEPEPFDIQYTTMIR